MTHKYGKTWKRNANSCNRFKAAHKSGNTPDIGFFLLGFYFYFYSVETPIFEKYSVGCYSVFFNHKKYSVVHYSVL